MLRPIPDRNPQRGAAIVWVKLDSGTSGSWSPDRHTAVIASGQETFSAMLRDEFGS
jgi:hypothetical protein